MGIAAASHNRFFEIVLEPLTSVFVQQVKLTNSYEVGVDQHRQIYEKIAKGDPIGARQAARRLMESTRKHVKAALQVLAPEV
jgi:DNA-binding FadR family transcriptional regulator